MSSIKLQLQILFAILLIYVSIISINSIFAKSAITKFISIGLMLISLVLVKKSELISKKSAQTLYIISFILIGLSLIA